MELEAKSRGEQAPVKTSLASTQTNGTDLGEHHSSEERQEHNHGHEHGHKLGHNGHHAQNLHATQTDSTEGVQSAKELEEHEAHGDEEDDSEDDSEDEEEAYCYGNDSRCKESAVRAALPRGVRGTGNKVRGA